MPSPVYSKPPAPSEADTDTDNQREIANILSNQIAKLAKAKPSNLTDQLKQWDQRVVLLYGETKDQTKIKDEVEKTIESFRKAAQHPTHTHPVADRTKASHKALRTEAEGHITALETEAKGKATAQHTYERAIRHLKQELDAYDGYAEWAKLRP
jgi:TolA-binding protein